jgi:hypothetical protein
VANKMDRGSCTSNDGFEDLTLMGDIGIVLGPAFGSAPISQQTCCHAAEFVLPVAMMGRHAAPVLHDPGTSTTVGPAPVSW